MRHRWADGVAGGVQRDCGLVFSLSFLYPLSILPVAGYIFLQVVFDPLLPEPPFRPLLSSQRQWYCIDMSIRQLQLNSPFENAPNLDLAIIAQRPAGP